MKKTAQRSFSLTSRSDHALGSAHIPKKRLVGKLAGRESIETGVSSQSERGFTFIETLVAIAILMTLLSSIYSVTVQGIRSVDYVSKQTIARFLAQDAMQYVVNISDSSKLMGDINIWSNFTDECVNIDGCQIDTRIEDWSDPNVVESCVGDCDELEYDEGVNQYGYGSGWQGSGFTRTVYFERFDDEFGPDEITRVTIEVSWQESGSTKSVRLQEFVYYW